MQVLQSLTLFAVHPGLLLLSIAVVIASLLGLSALYRLAFRRKPGDFRVGMVIVSVLIAGAFGWLRYTLDLSHENAPQLATPDNGDIALYRTVDPRMPTGPFRVSTNIEPEYSSYFIKVSDWGTSEPLLAMFVRGGQDAEVQLPVGSYRIMVARGPHWYGMERLFGKRTVRHEEIVPAQVYQSGPRETTGTSLHIYNGKTDMKPLK